MDRQKNRCTAALSNEKWVAVGLFSGIFFFFIGQPFIPLLGIETDEALFASPLFEPLTAIYSWHIGAHLQIPLMLISYLGCLKTLLYAPVFKLFGSGIHTIREPALIAGAVSVWLFFLLLRRVFGNLTAAIGCCLLSMDSLYLLTTCYDWGPVALQHLLIVGGALALVRFYQTQSEISLAAGWFLWGLALWDKALALWVLSGLGVAC
ncbi:MAG TPA: glycosyltransferase family 39 protein, partial [Bryobacteraceae bacterium]|nr:glycosyltransferase family 39 protein [Bryobacteraceae bacterium]